MTNIEITLSDAEKKELEEARIKRRYASCRVDVLEEVVKRWIELYAKSKGCTIDIQDDDMQFIERYLPVFEYNQHTDDSDMVGIYYSIDDGKFADYIWTNEYEERRRKESDGNKH